MRPCGKVVDKAHGKAIFEQIWPPNATQDMAFAAGHRGLRSRDGPLNAVCAESAWHISPGFRPGVNVTPDYHALTWRHIVMSTP